MKTMLAQIHAARMVALDWHYTAKGDSFYGQHLLAEKVAEGFPTDDLTETYYLGEKLKTPPRQADIMAEAVQIVSANGEKSCPVALQDILKLAAAHAEELARGNLSLGVKSLLDEVSQKCYQSIGLIERLVLK